MTEDRGGGGVGCVGVCVGGWEQREKVTKQGTGFKHVLGQRIQNRL